MDKNISPLDIRVFAGLFIFTIDDTEFCISMREVIRIIRPEECFKSIGESDTCIRYRGNEYQLVPINKIYKLNYNNSIMTRILIIEINKKSYGLIVDKINELIAVKNRSDKSLSILPDDDHKLNGIIKYNGRGIKFPNYKQIVLDSI
jgi:chemotaxis signal transduction protein